MLHGQLVVGIRQAGVLPMPALPLWWCLKIARRAPVSLQEVPFNGRASASEDQISCGLACLRVLSPRASVHTGSMISQPSCIVVHHPPLHAHHPEVILAACGPYKHAFGQMLVSSQALSSAYSAGAVYSILPVVLRRSTAVRCIRGK